MIDVAHFRQHPLKMEGIHQQPGEHAQPEVVKKDGHDLATNIHLDNNMMVFGFNDEQDLGYEETDNNESMNGVRIGGESIK